jgi:hypothetical protein
LRLLRERDNNFMLLNDSNFKTVRVPARWKNGTFINEITGEELAGIKDDSVCEIVVESHRISDLILFDILSIEEETEILPDGSQLFVTVNAEFTPPGLHKFLSRPDKLNLLGEEMLVGFRITKPLILKFQGTKQPSLRDCPCEIESLKSEDDRTWNAESLNHAYRLISTAFEPRRRSFGGNVFLKVFYFSSETDKLTRLCDLRSIAAGKFEKVLKEKYQTAKRQK